MSRLTKKIIQNYQNNAEFLQDALEKLELLLQRAVFNFRQYQTVNSTQVAGWQVITDAEIDQILLDHKSKKDASFLKEIESFEKKIKDKTQLILKRLQKNDENKHMLPINVLQRLFNLTLYEIDILIICLAPTLDSRYARIYAYLQDNINKIYPSYSLIISLLAPNLEERIALKSCFSSDSILLTWQLLQNIEGGVKNFDEISQHPLKLASDLSQYLLNFTAPIDNIAFVPQPTQSNIKELIISPALKNQLEQFKDYLEHNKATNNNSYLFYFYGIDQKSLPEIAATFFHQLSIPSYTLDANILKQYMVIYGVDKACDYVTQLIRQILLNNPSLMIITNADLLFTEENDTQAWLSKHLLSRMSAVFRFITLIGQGLEKFKAFFNKNDINVQLYTFCQELPDAELRSQLWQKALEKRDINIAKSEIKILANTFHFSASQIEDIVEVAVREAFGDISKVTQKLLLQYSKEQNKGKLSQLAHLLSTPKTFKEIILSEKSLSQLEEICAFKKYHQKVYHHWDFARKVQSREGLVALFHGLSGTGKTMAASIIAHELNLELYRIDLALMISKYIGETEKNLAQIFDAAKALDVILFFDEADTLFAKRTEIGDAHDRYANIETGYLLQRLEEYPGTIILATNLLQNIDDAFLRRFNFIVEFPFPNLQQRKYIWQKAFPTQAPLAKEIDYDFLAEKLKLAGGHISNIALHAAFLAARHNKPITMQYILQAANDEYQKLGKLFVKAEFKPYEIDLD